MSRKKIIIALAGVMLSLAIAANVELPLPVGIQAESIAVGTIESCDSKNYRGGKVGPALTFVGIKLGDFEAPYLRWNPEKNQLKLVEHICNGNIKVKISYRASRLLIRPNVTYWINSVEIIKT